MSKEIHVHVHHPARKPARDAAEIKYKGYVLTPIGGGKYNIYKPEGSKRVPPLKSGLTEQEAKAWVDKQGSSKDAHVKDASFPYTILHQGKKLFRTGKVGKNIQTGEESAEYEQVDPDGRRTGNRWWRTISGKLTADAGFDRREYSPREWNRLQGEINEVQKRIDDLKAKKRSGKVISPSALADDERILAKLKAEQAKFRTDPK